MTFALLSVVHVQSVPLHSLVPLLSPSSPKYESGAHEVPCKPDNADDPDLLNGMSSEELALLTSAADPFANSPVPNLCRHCEFKR